MSERAAFLEAIIREPDEDTTRLVFADWLDEHDEPGRAEFIRVQCELARMVQPVPPPDVEFPDAWLAGRMAGFCREKSLLDDLFGRPHTGCEFCLRQRERELRPFMIADVRDWFVSFLHRRGFVERVTCTAGDWLEHGDAIAWHPNQNRPCPETAQPVRRVTWCRVTPQNIADLSLCYQRRFDRPPVEMDLAEVVGELWPGVEFEAFWQTGDEGHWFGWAMVGDGGRSPDARRLSGDAGHHYPV